ncbi:MAG: 1-acyl-sn-glycerol-3-phosphate acyltransferase [Prolixibacteraceae bacterium]|nr:1-acyl-sn-glycerol-3-phosphate acyltransferase [Prolixibacteraceae bacterium]
MKRSFHSIGLNGAFSDQKKPVLLVCNHVSWWDGIWALHFNQSVLNRKYHFMMLEDQLQKNWFFKYTGGFSVAKKSRSVIETIDYTAKLLHNNKNVVLLFPQGEIKSMHQHDFTFEKGIDKIFQKLNNPVQIIMLANIVDYFSNSKPNLAINFKEYKGEKDYLALEKSYNEFHRTCIKNQILT